MSTIEKARPSDLSELLGIYNIARDFMKKNGNQNQRGSGYPEEKLLLRNLSEGNLYVLNAGGIPSAAFVLAIGKEPNYEKSITVPGCPTPNTELYTGSQAMADSPVYLPIFSLSVNAKSAT